MKSTLIVVSQLKNWETYAYSEQVVDLKNFIQMDDDTGKKYRIINLCSDYAYLSDGYYCSLLAESRGLRVSPSLKSLGMLNRPNGFKSLNLTVNKAENSPENSIRTLVVFGVPFHKDYLKIARQTFSELNFPLMRLTISVLAGKSAVQRVESIQPLGLEDLSGEEEDFFVDQIEKQASGIWSADPRPRQRPLSMGILVDNEEAFPPSNTKALKAMIKAAASVGIQANLIYESDFFRLGEFDALFIRATTAVNHYTYAFAVEAKRLGLAVIDDPQSILRCTNKVYLARLMQRFGISTPKTRFIAKDDPYRDMVHNFEYPTVFKIPDGSFSRGVKKAENPTEALQKLEELFEGSYLILQQEYVYTEYDWRIGVLNKQPLYACKYEMAKGHWQIIRHGATKSDSGSFETLPIRKVPPKVLKTALKAAALVGDGLYGVDVKFKDDQAYVIEINDNPNLDYGIEDLYQGDDMYRLIMLDFLRRIYQKPQTSDNQR